MPRSAEPDQTPGQVLAILGLVTRPMGLDEGRIAAIEDRADAPGQDLPLHHRTCRIGHGELCEEPRIAERPDIPGPIEKVSGLQASSRIAARLVSGRAWISEEFGNPDVAAWLMRTLTGEVTSHAFGDLVGQRI